MRLMTASSWHTNIRFDITTLYHRKDTSTALSGTEFNELHYCTGTGRQVDGRTVALKLKSETLKDGGEWLSLCHLWPGSRRLRPDTDAEQDTIGKLRSSSQPSVCVRPSPQSCRVGCELSRVSFLRTAETETMSSHRYSNYTVQPSHVTLLILPNVSWRFSFVSILSFDCSSFCMR